MAENYEMSYNLFHLMMMSMITMITLIIKRNFGANKFLLMGRRASRNRYIHDYV